MNNTQPHVFHVPVMGLGYTIDTPVKVGRFGISSVVSIIEDHLIEQMRETYCKKYNIPYINIDTKQHDYRAKRITAYLNLLNDILNEQVKTLKTQAFEPQSDVVKYFELLPSESPVRQQYEQMKTADHNEQQLLQAALREHIQAGAIDVNIMTKLDKNNYSPDTHEQLPPEYADAMSALRGFAMSNVSSSMVFSAGLNPRLYSYCETFPCFFPDADGHLEKKIILKVSDYRSALIQGKFFAKKGIWISEFRIESGLNCGGHAFATDGLLMGTILEEFKQKRDELAAELYNTCNAALQTKGKATFEKMPTLRITVQGGIGTANENKLLLQHYNVDSVGWGSPFLLVPEATTVDDQTLELLAHATPDNYYLSHASPLGIPFNNFNASTSHVQREQRIESGKPGSPCYKKFLAIDTEFTSTPICTASSHYQHLKIKQLLDKNLPEDKFEKEYAKITEKDCLCEGLGVSALLKNDYPHPNKLKAVAICPGPNLAFFSGTFSLQKMVDHIYNRANILNSVPRPHVFVNELHIYIGYLKNQIKNTQPSDNKQINYLNTFKQNLIKGIAYYKNLFSNIGTETEAFIQQTHQQLKAAEQTLLDMVL